MGTTDTSQSTDATPVLRAERRPNVSRGGLVIIGPTPEPLDGIDELLACPSLEPVEAMADRMSSWLTVSDEVIEVTRLTSQVLRRGNTAVVYLDSHSGDAPPVEADTREFVCTRLGQIMIGLADEPAFVALYSQRMARALIIDSLGDDAAEAIAVTPDGHPVWELTRRTMFPGVPVAACPGESPVSAIGDMISWFQSQD